MKIYTQITIDIETSEVLSESSYEYAGPVIEAKGSSGGDTIDEEYNDRMATIAEAQQFIAEDYHQFWRNYYEPYQAAQVMANLQMLQPLTTAAISEANLATVMADLQAQYADPTFQAQLAQAQATARQAGNQADITGAQANWADQTYGANALQALGQAGITQAQAAAAGDLFGAQARAAGSQADIAGAQANWADQLYGAQAFQSLAQAQAAPQLYNSQARQAAAQANAADQLYSAQAQQADLQSQLLGINVEYAPHLTEEQLRAARLANDLAANTVQYAPQMSAEQLRQAQLQNQILGTEAQWADPTAAANLERLLASVGLTQAQTGLTGAQTGLTQNQAMHELARMGLTEAQTGLVGAQTEHEAARQGLTEAQTGLTGEQIVAAQLANAFTPEQQAFQREQWGWQRATADANLSLLPQRQALLSHLYDQAIQGGDYRSRINEARANVASSFDASEDQMYRDFARRGVNPASGNLAAMANEQAMNRASAMGGAMTGARVNEWERNMQYLQGAAGLGPITI